MLQLEMVSNDFICNNFTVQDDTMPVQIISDRFPGSSASTGTRLPSAPSGCGGTEISIMDVMLSCEYRPGALC